MVERSFMGIRIDLILDTYFLTMCGGTQTWFSWFYQVTVLPRSVSD